MNKSISYIKPEYYFFTSNVNVTPTRNKLTLLYRLLYISACWFIPKTDDNTC